MKTVSTGVGLCVLGGCVLAAAVITSPHLGNAAVAAGGARVASPAVPPTAMAMPSLTVAGVPGGPAGWGQIPEVIPIQSSNMTSSVSCEDLEPEIWFTTVRALELCPDSSNGGYRGIQTVWGSYACDINGDSKMDFVSLIFNPGLTLQSADDTPVLQVDELVLDGGARSWRYRTTMTAGPMLAFIRSLPSPPDVSVQLFIWGPWWRDLDLDGDLDPILGVMWNGMAPGYSQVWIENTGYQAPPASTPYDLDHDGHVNTADLSLLLLEFTE